MNRLHRSDPSSIFDAHFPGGKPHTLFLKMRHLAPQEQAADIGILEQIIAWPRLCKFA